MLKVYDSAVTFSEFPDEIALCVNISNCPGTCDNCSEPWLREDIGEELTDEKINELINLHPNITVFGLMGGDSDYKDVKRIAEYVHKTYPNIKVGIYSGRDYIVEDLISVIDLYKIGRWITPSENIEEWKNKNWGPLQWPVSNQLLFEKINGLLVNITYKFRENLGAWDQYIIKNDNDNKNK